MIKKVYTKPELKSEAFVPQTHVAACGDSGKTYKFECNAGGFLGIGGNVYLETNNIEGFQENEDQYLSSYHHCEVTHEASASDEFLKGYLKVSISGRIIPVIIWRGPNHDNTHCTTNLDINSWETAKS